MQRYEATRALARHFFFFFFLFLTFTALPGYAQELTQRDWMIALVNASGWSYGLPDEPQDPDYINILTGNRDLRLKAKPYMDNVTFKSLFLFAGKSHITLKLPPGGGVDQLRLTGRQIDDTRANALLDFEQKGKPEARDLDSFATLLAAFGIER